MESNKNASFVIGQYAEISHKVSELDLIEFAKLSGDDNPLHIDRAYAEEIGNKGLVSHGILTASLISRVIGTRLPGAGALWMSQEIEFTEAVYPGDLLTARVSVQKIHQKDQVLELYAEGSERQCVKGFKPVDKKLLTFVLAEGFSVVASKIIRMVRANSSDKFGVVWVCLKFFSWLAWRH